MGLINSHDGALQAINLGSCWMPAVVYECCPVTTAVVAVVRWFLCGNILLCTLKGTK